MGKEIRSRKLPVFIRIFKCYHLLDIISLGTVSCFEYELVDLHRKQQNKNILNSIKKICTLFQSDGLCNLRS